MTELPDDMPAWLERAWLERYLARELDSEETRAFESYLLAKPALIAQLEVDNDLRAGLALVEDAADAVLPPAPRIIPAPAPAASIRLRPLPAWAAPLSLAACLALGIGLGLLLRGSAAGVVPRAGPSGAWVANPTRVLFDTLRGANEEARVVAGDPRSAWILVEAGVPSHAQSIRLQTPDGELLDLRPTPDGFIGVLLARAKAQPGTRLTLRYNVQGAAQERQLQLPASINTTP